MYVCVCAMYVCVWWVGVCEMCVVGTVLQHTAHPPKTEKHLFRGDSSVTAIFFGVYGGGMVRLDRAEREKRGVSLEGAMGSVTASNLI